MPRLGGVKWAQGLGSCKSFAIAGIPSLNEFWQKKMKAAQIALDTPEALDFIL